jgi:hypothetical protein
MGEAEGRRRNCCAAKVGVFVYLMETMLGRTVIGIFA